MKSESKQDLLSRLNSLRWISIDGCPSDAHQLKEIFSVSPRLCMFIVNMKFLLQFIDLKDEQSCISLLRNRIKHLSIQLTDETDLNNDNLERLSNVFSRVRHIIIENKINEISVDRIVLLFLDHFKNHPLVSIIIRGPTTDHLRLNPSQWLIDQTYLKGFVNRFKADCDEAELKIWL